MSFVRDSLRASSLSSEASTPDVSVTSHLKQFFQNNAGKANDAQ
jgi:hypothetical protein